MKKILLKSYIWLPIIYILVCIAIIISSQSDQNEKDGADFIISLLAYPSTFFAEILYAKVFGLEYKFPYWCTFLMIVIPGIVQYFIVGICMYYYMKWLRKSDY
jgi:hypothetical protein